LEDWLRRAYPMAAREMWYRSYFHGAAVRNSDGDLTTPSCGSVNGVLFSKKVWDFLFSDVPWDARYYGMVSDAVGFMRGCAMDIPSYVASGPTGPGTWGWDTDGSYGDWYGGHELAHTYGRGHANYCGAGGGPAYPYTGGRISPSLTGNTALYGFDIGNRAIYGPDWKDLMTYCDWQWMSDFTYEGIMNYFQSNLDSVTARARLAIAPASRLLVAGSINPRTREVSLQPLFIIPNAGEVLPRTEGAYAIVLRNARGAELARYPFTPAGLHDGRPRPQAQATPENPYESEEMLFIQELVPFMDGTTQVDIVGPTGVLKSVSAGAATPSVTVLFPNGGEVLSGSTITVTWSATDADRDALRFNVQYSRDNGASWEMLAQNISENSVALDANQIGSTTQGLFRVWVSDGINTNSDTSNAVFTVPNHAPEVAILAPVSGTTVAVSQTVAFEGTVFDVDTPQFPANQLTWTSSRDGALGTGESLAVATLSAGTHTITLTANDGVVAQSATLQLLVVASLEELPTERIWMPLVLK
jgi:hypothetical protein